MNARRLASVLLVVAVLLVVPVVMAAPALPVVESLTLTFDTPPYSIVPGASGDSVVLYGFYPSGLPGDPQLPSTLYTIALPPNVQPDSVAVEVTAATVVDVPGAYEIAPAPPAIPADTAQPAPYWGPNATTIVEGRNLAVYGRDAFFPAQLLTLESQGQMRKWQLVDLSYRPVQYNPVTGALRVATHVEARVTFSRQTAHAPALQAALRDTTMDDRAAEMIYNFHEARRWYEPAVATPLPATQTPFVIITTNQIVSSSAALSAFVAHKQTQGLGVAVITETQYDSVRGQAPNGRADKIRRWLQNHYETDGIDYVLLIGNPDPDHPLEGAGDTVGDVPMKMLIPRYGTDYYPNNQTSPSDHFYADLTGNWDKDGDGIFGEYNGDRGASGVDYWPEVYVGRIPVYRDVAGWANTLDSILYKTIAYENEADTSWRRSALLPMAFLDADTDTAYVSEAMKASYLNPRGFRSYTLYDQEPGTDSIFPSDEPLVYQAVPTHWAAHSYGLVTWLTHGSWDSAMLVLDSGDVWQLRDWSPAFVFQASCLNGKPEEAGNLGYALLQNGAVGTVSASRVSWSADTTSWIYSAGYADNGSLAYDFGDLITSNLPAGEALYLTKKRMGANWGDISWMNLDNYNLYGDPSVRLNPDPERVYISAKAGGAVAGIKYAPADILAYDVVSRAWSMWLDGSDVGLVKNVDAFAVRDDERSMILSLAFAQEVPGLGMVKPQDVIVFYPTSLGANTAGTFDWYIRGANVGLTLAAENVDALVNKSYLTLLSTTGLATVPSNWEPGYNIKGKDEDLFEDFVTYSEFDYHFIGANVPGLAVEDVIGADYQNGIYYLAIEGEGVIGGQSYDQKAIFMVDDGYQPLGRFWYGPEHGFNGLLDGIDVRR